MNVFASAKNQSYKLVYFRENSLYINSLIAEPEEENVLSKIREGLSNYRPVFLPKTREILFTSDYNIWAVNIDSLKKRQITFFGKLISPSEINGEFYLCDLPVVSPDSNWICFRLLHIKGIKNETKSFVCKTDGSQCREIFTEANFAGSWSPNSQKLVFAQRNKLVIVDVKSNKANLSINTKDGYPISPKWLSTKTSERIFFCLGQSIASVDSSGKNFRNDISFGDMPIFSSDGNTIVFHRKKQDADGYKVLNELWVTSIDSSFAEKKLFSLVRDTVILECFVDSDKFLFTTILRGLTITELFDLGKFQATDSSGNPETQAREAIKIQLQKNIRDVLCIK